MDGKMREPAGKTFENLSSPTETKKYIALRGIASSNYALKLMLSIFMLISLGFWALSFGCNGRVLNMPASLGVFFQSTSEQRPTSYEERALRLLEKNPLIDGHNDLAVKIRSNHQNHIYDNDFKEAFKNGTLNGHVDLKRIDDGRYGGAFWSVFWLCPANISDFSDESYHPIVKATLEQIDLVHRLSAQYPSYFPPTPSSSVARKNFHEHHIHIAPLGIEGLHQIGNSFSTLRSYYNLGVRYATLNWNCHNIYTDAALLTYIANGSATTVRAPPLWGGVSAQGRNLIREMNRMGMIVDLSHVSVDTMRDVLSGEHNPDFPVSNDTSGEHTWKGSLAPPIFSHSSAYAVCPHPRNVPDDVLDLVKRRSSVVMVNFSQDFVACHLPPGADPATELPTTDPANHTLEQVAQHIVYIGERIGYDYVGIGSDFDGLDPPPRGLEGVDRMPALVAELLRRGVTDEDAVKLVGGNVLRVWEEVERVSARLQKEGTLPAEDELPKFMSRGEY